MRSLIVAGLLAFIAAVLIAVFSPPEPLEERLIHLQVEDAMPQYADTLAGEPASLQALMLAYADDPVLLAKARLSLLRYPDMARPVLAAYGDSAPFQEVLRRYGEDILLPIHYFRENEVLTLELMRGVNETARSAMAAIRGLWNGDSSSAEAASGPLTVDDRGWYAIQFLQAEGYDFLGQFVRAPDGSVAWVQTERMLEGINSLFAGGIRGLETKLRQDQAIAAGDVGWAALDVAVGVSAFKLLRMGRTGAAGGRSLSFSERSAAVGAGLWRGSVIGVRVAKYGAPAVLAYMAVRHPSVINSLLGSAAERLGLPVMLVQVVGWTLVLLPVIWLLRLVAGPLAWVLGGLARLLGRRGRSQPPAAVKA